MEPVDGTRGWAKSLWEMLADGAIWGVPRTGLVYVKDEQAKTLTLVDQMPWNEELPVTEEDLLLAQDAEHKMTTMVFEAIGVEVKKGEAEHPMGLCRYCYRTRFIEEVEQTEPFPQGKCTQCVREGVTEPLTPFSL